MPIHVRRLLDFQIAIANRIVPAARKSRPGMKNTIASPKQTEFTREGREGFFSLIASWPIACNPKVSAPY
jgi:hypothetical protein